MTWVDLLIICVFLWGGVTGYLAGWQRTICRLAVLLLAVLFAMTFKGDMSIVIGEHYPFEQAVKEIVDGRLALPVDTFPVTYPVLLANLNIPRVLHRLLLDHQFPHAPVDFIQLGDRLTCFMTDLIAFSAMFILWWPVLGLFGWIYSKRSAMRSSTLERWGGILIGLLNQLLIVSLLLGAFSSLFWLMGLDPDLTVLEEGSLARMGLQLFERMKLP